MKRIAAAVLVAALGMSGCEINTPAGAPGPAGEKGAPGAAGTAGAQGAQGDKGKPATNTVVVVPSPNTDAK